MGQLNAKLPAVYYHMPADQVRPIGLLLGLLGGAAAGLLAAIVYAYALIYIPFIYANVACVLAFGGALGFVPAWIMQQAKVRSVPAVLAIVAIVTAVAYGFHWFVWIYALVNRAAPVNVETMASQPGYVIELIGHVYRHGTWGIGSEPLAGVPLGIIWLVEIGAIFRVAIWSAKAAQGKTLFCEACDRWCSPPTTLGTAADTESAEFKREMEARNWEYFDRLGPSPDGARRWFVIRCDSCFHCNQLHAVTAVAISLSDDPEQTRLQRDVVVDKLLLTFEDTEILRRTSADHVDQAASINEETGETP